MRDRTNLWAKWSLDAKFFIGFAGVLGMLAVFGMTSYWSLNQLLESHDRVKQTYEAIQVIGNILSHIKDIETEKRDFVLTGNERHLAPYHAVKARFAEELRYLDKLVPDSTRQQERVDELGPLINKKITIADEAIEARKTQGFEVARSLVITEQSEQVMDQIRSVTNEMEAEERANLRTRYRGETASVLRAYLVMSFGGVLAFIFVGFVSLFIRRDIDERKRAAKLLAAEYAVNRILVETEKVAEVIPKILQAICQGLDWKMGAMWRVNPTAHLLRCEELWYEPDLRIAEFLTATRSGVFASQVGLPGRVWASAEPAWIPDVLKDSNFPRAKYAAKAGFHSAFAVPILFGPEVLGVIEFFSPKIRRPDDKLLKTTLVLGGQIGQYLVRKEAQKKEEEALKVKSEFTAMVSHELRTPLTVIKESIGIVEDGSTGPVNPEQKDFLDTAKRNVDRLTRLINSVLDYQKLEAGRMEFKMALCDLNEIVREAQKGFELFAKTKNLSLEVRLAEDLPLVSLDKDKIAEVLVNLVNNAVKFTDRGMIKIETAKEGESAVRLTVSDQGIGIKQEDLSKLFKSFSQISSGIARRTGGTGLGLAISKSIMENHGGRIGVESAFGKGSSFYFILPVARVGA